MSDQERAFDGDSMTAEQLREELRQRELPTSGKKSELLDRLNEAVQSEAEEGLVPVIRFDGLKPNQIYNHGRRQFMPGHEEPVDPDRLAAWHASAIQAGVATIVRVPQEG